MEAYSFSLGVGSNTGVRVIAFFPWGPGGSVSGESSYARSFLEKASLKLTG